MRVVSFGAGASGVGRALSCLWFAVCDCGYMDLSRPRLDAQGEGRMRFGVYNSVPIVWSSSLLPHDTKERSNRMHQSGFDSDEFGWPAGSIVASRRRRNNLEHVGGNERPQPNMSLHVRTSNTSCNKPASGIILHHVVQRVPRLSALRRAANMGRPSPATTQPLRSRHNNLRDSKRGRN